VNAERTLSLSITGPAMFDVKVIGAAQSQTPIAVAVAGGKLRALRVLITIPAKAIASASEPIVFSVGDSKTMETTQITSVFLSDGTGP
jgi:hypothetical protein